MIKCIYICIWPVTVQIYSAHARIDKRFSDKSVICKCKMFREATALKKCDHFYVYRFLI